MIVKPLDHCQHLHACFYITVYSQTNQWGYATAGLGVSTVEWQSDSNMLKTQYCIFSLMQEQSHSVDNVSQNNIPEGYAERKQSQLCKLRGLICKAASTEKIKGERKKKTKSQTHLKVVVCVLLCISACLSGAASLSFCLLLFVPSPHFSGLRSYGCPNNPSSRKKKEKRGSRGGEGGGGRCRGGGGGEEEEVVEEEEEGGNVERKINKIH